MKKFYSIIFIVSSFCFSNLSFAQTSQEFWFAPPEITSGHGALATQGLRLVMATGATPATVTIDQPANLAFNGGVPIVINIPANSGHIEDMTPHRADLETMPQDVILNTGLHISSTANITCYYEVTTTNNPDIFALKGANGLGTEFYTPFQTTWANGAYVPAAYTSFDIIATVDNTTVIIYPRVPLDGGHPALTSYSITLNRGQTYSGAVTGGVGVDNPAGTAIVSDNPIAVSIKDDSMQPAPAGCRDLNGDQIVPVDIVGNDYIVTKGGLTVPEYVYIVSTANGNVITVDGTPVATLFAGETFRVLINNPTAFIQCSKPTYSYHLSGFGCEVGGALLPPLNCAGSSQVNVVRSTTEFFALNIVVPTGAEGAFQLNGNPALIPATAFAPVPNTGGAWMFAQINYNTIDVPVGTNNLITNSTDVFSVGLINGGAASGTRFGYFSEFSGKIFVNAGTDLIVCANDTAQLNGSVTGGATTGIWSSNGSGTFIPSNTALNAMYVPSNGDILAGNVMLTLTSTSICFPEMDQMNITFAPAPTANAGIDQTVCGNNPIATLNGSVTIATGGVWSGGAGTFLPNAATLNATYTPTAGEITAGSVTLTLTTTGNGTCNPENDAVTIFFGPAPTANAGVNQSVCENNPNVTLAGLVTVATGGVWSGGAGTFTPNNTSLNTVYTPTAGEITAGSVTLTLTTTGNGNCNAVSDNILINFTLAPTANAGVDQTVCTNNANVILNGAVTGATGGSWSGGLGTFTPNNTTLNATYSPTAAEISAGTVTLILTTTGNGNCNAVTDNMTVTITPAPTVNAGIDQTVCGNNALVTLNGSVTIASGGSWSGGAGVFTPNNSTLNATYMPTAAEILAGTVTLTLTSTGNGNCTAVTDNMVITITPAPQVNAGVNQTLCANNPNATLTGVVSGATGGVWSGGGGSFNPSATALNAIYTPSGGEIASGSVILTLTSTGNGLCNAVSDNVQLTFTLPPTANAGADQTLCSNNSSINLNGSVTIATGGQWTGGLGVFTPNNNTLNAIYNPTVGEIASGSVTLTLTTTGNGTCNAATDNMTVFFTPTPVVDAGINQTVCANNPTITLNGSVTIAGGGVWTGGTGSFVPNNTTLNASYTPSAAEITAGTVTLFLTSTGNGNCLAVTDSMILTITPLPTANAGIDLTSCANNPTVALSGTITGATGGIWTGGAGLFSPGNTSLGATYTPSAAEILAGTVTLTLTSTGNGNCNAVSDNMTITITSSPTVNAGIDQTVCANNANVNLNGSVTLASGGQWTGGLGIFTPNNNALNAIYSPTLGEIASGSVTLTLTTTGNGNCNAEVDQMTITFTPAPTISAGLDQSVCENNPTVTLNGAVAGATGAQWSGGLGLFAPSNNALNATYTPTASEILAGSLTLFLTSTGNGNCLSVVDSMVITFTPAPTVNAGLDQTICVNNLNVNLNGSVSGPTSTGVWTTSGTGFFIPSNTALNAVYQASPQDSIAGTVTLTLTSTGNGSCNAVFDDMTITILPAGGANSGLDQTVCANNANVSLNGSITGNASGGTWSSSGTGVFVPNATSLTATYIPSPADSILGTVTITLTANSCNLATDNLIVTITPAPIVDAGTDITVCVSNLNVPLNGSVSGASTTGIWTTSGTGTFSPNNTTLNATYNASSADSLNQGVTLVLTATGIGSCLSVTDTVLINLFPTGVANAGADQTVCANNATITLNGSITGGATSGQWTTTGSGTFLPNDTTLNATYVPSSADATSGSVNLILTATNSCSLAADFMTLTITPAPVVNAGPDQIVCGTIPTFNLSGSVTGPTTTGVWTTSGTGTFSSTTSMTPTYTASAADITNGGVTIFLTSTGNGLCNPVVDSLLISITTGISVNAGPDQAVCVSSTQSQLIGAVFNGSTTGVWTTTGTGTFFPHDSLMTAIYQFSPGDFLAGSITFVLTSTNNGSCAVETDTMIITFGNSAFAFAGANQSICADNLSASLNGIVSGGSSTGIWTTNGSGLFTPSDTDLVTTYTPSNADSLAGTVDIYLTTTNNDGGCLSGVDTLTITIDYVPVVNAGADQTICNVSDSVFLNGNIQLASGGNWTTLGTGTFFPNSSTLSAIYQLSPGDIANGFVTLILTSNNNGSCSPQSDTMQINITPPPVVDAGVDQSICADNLVATLNGIVSGGTTTGIWSTSGSGTFSPTNTALTGSYIPSSADSIFGSVQLILTSTNNGGCLAVSDTLILTIDRIPVANAGTDQTICNTVDSVFLNGSTQFATGGTWSSNGTGIFVPNNTTMNAIYVMSAADITNGTVQLTLTTSGSGFCADVSDVMIITVSNPLVVDFEMIGQCVGQNINFFDSTTVLSGSILSWSWTFGDGGTSSVQNPTYTYNNIGNFTVTLVVTSTTGCVDSLSKSLTINALPTAQFDFGTPPFFVNDVITFNDQSTGATNWSWTFGDGVGTSTTQNPTYTYTSPGVFVVTQFVTNAAGCTDSISKEINIEENNVIIYPPNFPTAFTPNGDGNNDVFFVRGGPFNWVNFRVFNEWGEVIFSSQDAAIGWDGTHNGSEVPIGTYVYTLKAETIDGIKYEKSGKIALIR